MNSELSPHIRKFTAMVVGRISGRLIGTLPIAVCAIMAVGSWYRSHPSVLSTLALLLAAIPCLAAAFLIHELGHFLALRYLGLGARLEFHPPVDLRTVPIGSDVRHSTGVPMIVRGLSGWAANMLCLLLLAVTATVTPPPIAAFTWWAAMWHAVSALTATAWAAHAPLTDAASLSNAVVVADQVRITRRQDSGVYDIAVSIDTNNRIVRPRQHSNGWWLWISGLEGVEVQGAPLLELPTPPGETLLYLRDRGQPDMEIQLSGTPTQARPVLATRGGSIITLAG